MTYSEKNIFYDQSHTSDNIISTKIKPKVTGTSLGCLPLLILFLIGPTNKFLPNYITEPGLINFSFLTICWGNFCFIYYFINIYFFVICILLFSHFNILFLDTNFGFRAILFFGIVFTLYFSKLSRQTRFWSFADVACW